MCRRVDTKGLGLYTIPYVDLFPREQFLFPILSVPGFYEKILFSQNKRI